MEKRKLMTSVYGKPIYFMRMISSSFRLELSIGSMDDTLLEFELSELGLTFGDGFDQSCSSFLSQHNNK